MKKYARIENGAVDEIISTDKDINTLFHPDIVKTFVQCDDTVKCGFIYDGTTFSEPVITPIDARQNMTISAAQARLNLAAYGILQDVLDHMNTLPDTDTIKILWEYSTEYHRNNPILIGFLQDKFSMTNDEIDALFIVQ